MAEINEVEIGGEVFTVEAKEAMDAVNNILDGTTPVNVIANEATNQKGDKIATVKDVRTASWVGTKERFDKEKVITDPDNKDYIADGTLINIIGDPNDTLTVSTTITPGDMNPITSDAVSHLAQVFFDLCYPLNEATYVQYKAGDEHNPNVLFNNSMIKSKWQLVNDPDHEYLYTVSTKEEIGNVRAAGLPNIKGSTGLRKDGYASSMALSLFSTDTAGVFYGDAIGYGKLLSSAYEAGGKGYAYVRFDASQGGKDPVYGKSTTVQPRSRAIGIWERTE